MQDFPASFADSLRYLTDPEKNFPFFRQRVTSALLFFFFPTLTLTILLLSSPSEFPPLSRVNPRSTPLPLITALPQRPSRLIPMRSHRPGAAPQPATLDGGGEGNQLDEAAICTWYFWLLCMPSILFTILGGGGGAPRGCILRDCSHGIPTPCHSLIGRSWRQDVR